MNDFVQDEAVAWREALRAQIKGEALRHGYSITGATVFADAAVESIRRGFGIAPTPQPVQEEAAEHRMMLDDLRLYGAAFSKNGKRIPPEDVYITQPRAPAVGDDETLCDKCGNPTMHMGRTCYACSHPTPAVQIAAPGDVERLPAKWRDLGDLSAEVAAQVGDDLAAKVVKMVNDARDRCAFELEAALRSQGQAE